MEWPYRRFLKAFDAFQRRILCDEWKFRKATHVAALFSNCVSLDVRVLTRRGVLSHNAVCVGDQTIGYNPETGLNEWTDITDVHHTSVPVPTIRLSNKFWEIRTTPDHRWLTKQKRRAPQSYLPTEFRTADKFDWGTYIVASEPFYGPGLPISDDEAELIGWVLSDGSVLKNSPPRQDGSIAFTIRVYQSKPKQVEHLDVVMGRLGAVKEPTRQMVHVPPDEREYGVFYDNYPQYMWRFDTQFSMDLYSRAGLQMDKRVGVMDFVLSLNRTQLERFMEAVWMGEGVVQGKNGRGLSQRPGPLADAFEVGIYLLGYKPSRSLNCRGMANYTYGIPRMRASQLRISDPRLEPVWCVTTSLGTWTAQTDSCTFLTGNTNLDDEKNDRSSIVQKLERTYDDLIARIWNGGDSSESESEEEVAWESAFMLAGRKTANAVQPPQLPGEAEIGTLPVA